MTLTLIDELRLVVDHADAQGYVKAARWIERAYLPRIRRAKTMVPPPKNPLLDRPPRDGDTFRNLRTGWQCMVLEDPADGYVRVLNGLKRSYVQVNRLLDPKLYKIDGG